MISQKERRVPPEKNKLCFDRRLIRCGIIYNTSAAYDNARLIRFLLLPSCENLLCGRFKIKIK